MAAWVVSRAPGCAELTVANLQWQTIEAAKAKDRWETKGSRR